MMLYQNIYLDYNINYLFYKYYNILNKSFVFSMCNHKNTHTMFYFKNKTE